MDGYTTLRELLGTKVTLVQRGLRVEGLITELAVRIANADDEDAQLHVDTADGPMHVLWLSAGDWTQAVRLFPLHHFLPDQPVVVEWEAAVMEPPSPSRRARPSALAE